MVKQSMDLLELLRKRGIDGDVDFLREALRVLRICDAGGNGPGGGRRRRSWDGSPRQGFRDDFSG